MTEQPEAQPPATDPREAVIDRMLQQQMTEMRRSGSLGLQIRPETRCRVCQDENTRQLVNRLLSHGIAYSEIVGILEPVNKLRRKNNKISYNSVWTHARRHFNVQEPARALYRTILEKRAKEVEAEYVEGVGHHVNVLSYLETVMVKGYQELVSENQNVSVEQGMSAALKLNRLLKEESSDHKAAEQLQQMNKIIAAVKEVVPEKYYSQILAKLEDSNIGALDVEEEVIDAEEVADFEPDDDFDDRDSMDD